MKLINHLITQDLNKKYLHLYSQVKQKNISLPTDTSHKFEKKLLTEFAEVIQFGKTLLLNSRVP